MSWCRYRQPALESKAAAAQPTSRKRDRLIIGNLCDMMRMEVVQETRAFLHMKFCVVGLDAKEKAVRRCVLERCTLKTGWCGCGRRLSASMPKTAQREAPRTVSSKVTGINAGQLFSGRPPIFMG